MLDFSPPTVTGTSNLTAYRNGQTVRYTLAFSEPVLRAADLSALTAGTIDPNASAVFEAPAADFEDGVHGIDERKVYRPGGQRVGAGRFRRRHGGRLGAPSHAGSV